MEAKIKVHGKAMNRTVLGIMNAYIKLNPKTTLAQLNEAFPGTLSDTYGDSLFASLEDKDKYVNRNTGENTFEKRFLEREDELIHFADGSVVALGEQWVKADYEKVVAKAKEYGILAEVENTGAFQRGGYTLEDLTPAPAPKAAAMATPAPAPKKEEKKKCCCCSWMPCWLKSLLLLLLLIVLCALLLKFCYKCPYCKAEAENGAQVTCCQHNALDAKAQAEADSIAAAQKAAEEAARKAAEAQKAITEFVNQQNIGYKKASSTITPDSYGTLDKIAETLKANPDLKLDVIGHASPEGNPDFNQRLSEQRAQAVKDYLVKKGANPDNITAIGVGSSQPVGSSAEANRCVEFKVKA